MEQNLTTGSVFRNVVRFSLPYLLVYFLQTLYGMADLFIIGQYEGVAATTAVSIGSQVMHMLTVMLVGLAMGTTVSIARAVGAGNRAEAAKATGNTVTLFAVVSLALTAVLLVNLSTAYSQLWKERRGEMLPAGVVNADEEYPLLASLPAAEDTQGEQLTL